MAGTPASVAIVRLLATSALLGSSACLLLRSDAVVEIVLSLQERLHFNCVYIVLSHQETDTLRKSRALTDLLRQMATYHQTGILQHTFQKDFIHSCSGMPLFIVPNKDLLFKAPNMTELFEKRQSEFIWLLVMNDREPDLVLHDLHIEFNSNFYVAVPSVKGRLNILEAYRVGKGYPLATKKYCTWHASKQPTCTNETIGMRRKDLMGYNMKLGVVEDWPDVTFFNKTHCGGYVCEVWEVLSQRINVTYSFEGSAIYGSRPVNGTWEGLMGQLQQGRLDIGLAPLMVTAERRSAVDFSLPLVSSRLVLLLREPKEELMWDEFLRPFDRYLWLGTITVIVLIWVVLRVQKRYRGGLRYHNDYIQTYSDALHVAGIFFMQGCGEGGDTKSRCSVRSSLLVASMSAMVVYTAYCGALTASLAAHRLRMPFTDLKGLLRDGSYKLLLLYASGEMAMFDNTSDPVLSSIYEKHVEKENVPMRSKEILERICNSHKIAGMIPADIYRACKRLTKCPIVRAQESINMQTAIAFRKRSPYRELINCHLLQMRSEGLTHRLYWKHWPGEDAQKKRESLKPVAIQNVVPALAVLAAAAQLSICLLLLERKSCKRPSVRNVGTNTD